MRRLIHVQLSNNGQGIWLLVVFLVIIMAILAACDRKNGKEDLPPIACAETDPGSGKTTTEFSLNASASDPGNLGDKLYFRWDWENDGQWDQPFSGNPVSIHRYLVPGDYNPVLQVLNSSGLMDTCMLAISVTQGYSAPIPFFEVIPGEGNCTTTFQFDVSQTRDDEDSLSQLTFRWDWEGDGQWDSNFSSVKPFYHQFKSIGVYRPVLQVRDPGGLTSTFQTSVTVNNINLELIPRFDWLPIHPIEEDTVIFDASASSYDGYSDDKRIFYWKIIAGDEPGGFEPENMDGWMGPGNDPVYTRIFVKEGVYRVGLRMMDENKLQNQLLKTLRIYHKNRPPVPIIKVSAELGNLTTRFIFNAWETYDEEDLPTSLQVRWDFDGDQLWDTELSKEKVVYYQYRQPGLYQVIMEARDPMGLADTTSVFVTVTPGTNETGVVLDTRWGANEYYSTVKIGNQWWMSENMKYAPYRYTDKVDTLASTCYQDLSDNCEIHGGLYTAYSATQLNLAENAQGICPDGWHIPTLEEWGILIETIGGEQNVNELLPGGSSDFNATYAGYSYKRFSHLDDRGRPVYKWYFIGLGETGYYWTSTTPRGDARLQNHYTVTFRTDEPIFSTGLSGNSNFYSVRCIKN